MFEKRQYTLETIQNYDSILDIDLAMISMPQLELEFVWLIFQKLMLKKGSDKIIAERLT